MNYEPDPSTSNHSPDKGDINIEAITESSYFAIGHGARVIVNQALSAAKEAEAQRDFEHRLLAQAIAAYVEKLHDHVSQATEADSPEPYKALLPYRIADAPLFFGRDQAQKELLANMGRAGRGAITILHAESGAGKTSLLQAGLAAALLANEHLPLYVRPWRRSPTEAIKRVLLPDLNPAETPALAQDSLRAFLTKVTAVLGPKTLFILLDQFEEFFIRLQDETARRRFIEELGECVDDPMLQVHFVLALRADSFANLSEFRTRIPYIFNNEYALKLLTRAEAASAVGEPAKAGGLAYEPGLVMAILTELQADEPQRIMPPQLQLVCWALYQEVKETGQMITHAMLQEMGGVAGILRNYLTRVIDTEFSPRQRDLARQVLETLVRSDRTRDIKSEEELARLTGSDPRLPQVLEQLAASRLLRVIEDDDPATAAAAYELAHDYLVPQIELDPETLARKAAQELLDQAVEAWLRNPELRLGDEQLKIIKTQEKKIAFTPESRELYRLSKKAQRRRRGFLFGFLGTTVLGVLAAVILLRFWTDAEARRADAEAAAQAAEDRQVTAELAADAAEARQATAQSAAAAAAAARAEAVSAETTARAARQEAETGQAAAEAAEATALVARRAAETLQAQAEAGEAEAVAAQQTAQVGEAAARTAEAQAAEAQQTALAGKATAQANQATAQASEATAQARQSEAEEAARRAAAAQAAAEAAQEEAERARREAEEAAEEADRERQAAEAAARSAEATRVAVDALRATAEADLAQTRQLAAIIRHTQDCPASNDPNPDARPEAVAYDGHHLWVINKGTNTVAKLNAGDCSPAGSYPTGDGPVDIIYSNAYIWIAERLDNTVRKLDPDTGGAILFPAGPPGSEPTALLYAANAIWVTSTSSDGSQNKLRKIDPQTGADLGTINTERNPSDLIFAAGHIWVANKDHNSISKIEPATMQGQGNFSVEGLKPNALIYDGASIWVANKSSDRLARLEPATGAVIAALDTGPGPDALAFDRLNIWSANEGGNTLSKIDRAAGERRFDLPTGREPTDVLYDGANLWVVAELDNIVQKIPVNTFPVGQDPVALTALGNDIWVANRRDQTLSRVSIATNNLVRTFALDYQPVALTTAGAAIWAAHGDQQLVSKVDNYGTILGTFPTGGHNAEALTFGGGAIWLITGQDNALIQMREADGQVVNSPRIGERLVDILYAGGAVWAADAEGQVLRKIDAQGNQMLVSDRLGGRPDSFVYDGTYFWVSYPDFNTLKVKLRQVRASDGAALTTITTAADFGASTLAYDGRYLWLASQSGTNPVFGKIIRIDPQNPTGTTLFRACSEPGALLRFGSGVWVTCQVDGLLQKLSDSMPSPPTSILPSNFNPDAANHLYLPLLTNSRVERDK